MDQQPGNAPAKSLKIWQQNLNKSAQAQFSMVFNTDKSYDILALQEPNIDKYGNTKSISRFYSIYPATHLDSKTMKKKTRSVILVSTHLSTGSWTAIPVRHPDITAIQLTGTYGTLRIFNLYVDGHHDEAL
ncbi:hypothetical protein GGU10DRAFT_278073, partial [Lentinula aff. detonsa]